MTQIKTTSGAGRRILVVDDDSVTRLLIEHHLKRVGYEVVSAAGVAEAKGVIEAKGVDTLNAVVTDYLMPDGTGLELIEWLKTADEAIGTIIVTSLGERDLVKQSLRGGASDFLDKPLQIESLLRAVASAVDHTERGRHLKNTESSVQEVGRFQQFMLGTSAEGLAAPVEICWHPMHPVGGDLVNVIPLGPQRFLLLAADVSGHDLKAGFISAYFQGVVRGMVEKGTPIEEVFAYFNRFLLTEWTRESDRRLGAEHVAASISACAFVVDFAQHRLSVFNSGFPVPVYAAGSGSCEACGQEPGFPLGWFLDNPADVSTREFPQGGSVYIWTDGLEELAARLEVNPLALATELITARRENRPADCLAQANDDILVVCLNLNGPSDQGEAGIPLIYQELSAGQDKLVDEFQTVWNKSLRLAFPKLSEDRLFDILLCSREAVVNAILYGCDSRLPGRSTFEVCCDAARSLIRVRVSDQGQGHDFCWQTHVEQAADDLIASHRGLALIHQIPSRTQIDRRGALVTMDFALLQP